MSHTKRQYYDPVRRFVDLEAEVREEDGDEDEDLPDGMGFIGFRSNTF